MERTVAASGAAPSVERRVQAVALVTSAGGLDALTSVLRPLPPGFPAAIVVAQHLSRQGSMLVEILDRRIGLPVEWAYDGGSLAAGTVSVCPARSVLEVMPDRSYVLRPCDGAADHPLDGLLSSIGDSFGAGAIGVVLTGMGNDGSLGAAALRAAGGVAIAQSKDTAQHPAMPAAAISAGAVDLVLPLHEIGPALLEAALGRPLPAAGDPDTGRGARAERR